MCVRNPGCVQTLYTSSASCFCFISLPPIMDLGLCKALSGEEGLRCCLGEISMGCVVWDLHPTQGK